MPTTITCASTPADRNLTAEDHLARVVAARAALDAAELVFRCTVDEAAYAAQHSDLRLGDGRRLSLRRIAAAAHLTHPGVTSVIDRLFREARKLGVERVDGRWIVGEEGGRCARHLPPYDRVC